MMSASENPFVRRFILRHWLQQRKLAGELRPLPPGEPVADPPEWEGEPTSPEQKKNRLVFFISDEESGKTA